MWGKITGFIETAAGLNDEDALFGLLESTISDLGWPYWAFGALWGDPEAFGAHKAPAVRLNYPPEWISRYFELGYDKIDPVVSVSPYAQTSVTWEELRPYRPAFFDDAARYGLKSGISIPLRAISGCYVLCIANGDRDKLSHAARVRLETLAHGFFGAYLRIRKLESVDHHLTPHTVDVIRYSMAGLSAEEIAERTGLSIHGVYWCLKDARKKLGCETQPQMFLRAIQRGIVAL